MTDNPWIALDRALVGDIYTSGEPMENLAVLCDDLGARFVGTPQEHEAAEFIAATFRRYGLTNVALEDYGYQGWTRGPTTVCMVAPRSQTFDAISLPLCPPGVVQGALVDVGRGTPEEFAAMGSLDGAIAMVHSSSPPGYPRWIHRKEKYDRARSAGAVAFVFVSEQPGLGPETGSLMDDAKGPIPGVSVRFEDGALLQRTARRHGPVTLRIETTDRFAERTSWNVVAEIRGATNPDEVILLGSHYDGHDIAQGATDPASGLIVVMEVARVLAAHAADALDRTVRFVGFGTEEIGLIGSERYVARHGDELDDIRFMLNLDATGAMGGDKGVSLHQWPELEPFFREVGLQMQTPFPIAQKINAHSDHWAFFRAGVPSGWMTDPLAPPSGRGWGHTRFDTYDKVPVRTVREACANAARLVLRLSNTDRLPARRSADDVDQLIATHPRLEDHRISQRLAASMERGT